MIYLVDWLTFSSKKYTEKTILEFLQIGIIHWQSLKGFWGYMDSLYFGGIRIHFGGNDGVCVNMSGQGCRTFESISGLEWFSLFGCLLDENSFNVTRLDIACDEKDGILPLKKIADITNKFIAGNKANVCTKFTWADVNNSTQGLSVYYGSPKSDFRIRMYDKARERGLEDGTHWIRTELQIRDTHALNTVRSILTTQDIGRTFTGIVNNYLRFVNPTHTRACKCSNKRWWDRFLHTAEKISIFTRVGIEYNLKNIKTWVDKQVGNSLQTWVRCSDGDIGELLEVISKPRLLSRKQKDLIAQYELIDVLLAKPKD